jgi:hypothetical protein
VGCKVIKKYPWHHRDPPGPLARRPPSEKRFPPDFFFHVFGDTPKKWIAGMTADSDRHLVRFERVSPLTLSMGIAADLGIALVISKPSSSRSQISKSKARDI